MDLLSKLVISCIKLCNLVSGRADETCIWTLYLFYCYGDGEGLLSHVYVGTYEVEASSHSLAAPYPDGEDGGERA